jgi:hypothetical protein
MVDGMQAAFLTKTRSATAMNKPTPALLCMSLALAKRTLQTLIP